MEINTIKEVLKKSLALDKVYVSGNGRHFKIIAVSDQFTGLNEVKKQQMIYAPLMDYISDNHIHALSIKTYTLKEWLSANKLNIFKCDSYK